MIMITQNTKHTASIAKLKTKSTVYSRHLHASLDQCMESTEAHFLQQNTEYLQNSLG